LISGFFIWFYTPYYSIHGDEKILLYFLKVFFEKLQLTKYQ
jgi:hypothetical protein